MAAPKFVKRTGRFNRWRWKHPWSVFARRSKRFRKFCWDNGYVSPHFSRQEWASKDGTPVPYSLRRNAQRQAFSLERLRHALGDKPLSGISYYRSPEHNAAVGGASQSRHMQADATDFSEATVDSFGRTRFLNTAERFYANDGVGVYPGGSVHLDQRGYRSRWSSY